MKQNKGFTIIEALVALVILSLILIGLLSAALTSYRISLNNKIRDEAVKIAQEKLNTFKTTFNTSIIKHDICPSADNSDKVERDFGNFKYPFYVVGKIQDKGYFYEVVLKVCDRNKKEVYSTKTVVRKDVNQ